MKSYKVLCQVSLAFRTAFKIRGTEAIEKRRSLSGCQNVQYAQSSRQLSRFGQLTTIVFGVALTFVLSTPMPSAAVASMVGYSSPEKTGEISVVKHESDWYAIGDSYMSGEGTFDYYPIQPSSKAEDFCHRSPLSYASLLGVPQTNNFSCSGSTIADIAKYGNQGEPAQVPRLPHSARLVLVGAGGDSFNFSTVLKDCLRIGPFQGNCATELLTEMEGIEMPNTDPPPATVGQCNFASLSYRNQFVCMLLMLHARAPKAKIFVIGYPRLFVTSPTKSCSSISVTNQKFLNVGDAVLDGAINQWTALAARYGVPASFVSTWNTFAGHEECQPTPDLNPLVATSATAPIALLGHTPVHKGCHSPFGTFGACSESFHPTKAGYLALARVVGSAIKVYLDTR